MNEHVFTELLSKYENKLKKLEEEIIKNKTDMNDLESEIEYYIKENKEIIKERDNIRNLLILYFNMYEYRVLKDNINNKERAVIYLSLLDYYNENISSSREFWPFNKSNESLITKIKEFTENLDNINETIECIKEASSTTFKLLNNCGETYKNLLIEVLDTTNHISYLYDVNECLECDEIQYDICEPCIDKHYSLIKKLEEKSK